MKVYSDRSYKFLPKGYDEVFYYIRENFFVELTNALDKRVVYEDMIYADQIQFDKLCHGMTQIIYKKAKEL